MVYLKFLISETVYLNNIMRTLYKFLFALSLFFITKLAIAQQVNDQLEINDKLVIGGEYGGPGYSFRCPSYLFSNNGQISTKWDIHNHNNISLIENSKEYIEARKIGEKYIVKVGGNNFYEQLEFYDVEITYKDSVDKVKNIIPSYDLKICGETKYVSRYIFKPIGNVQYRIGIVLNNNLEIISKRCFPNYIQNPGFYKIISPLNAYDIAKKQDLISCLDEIELVFAEKDNCFVWDLIEEKIYDKRIQNYIYRYVVINAVTGDIIDSGKRKTCLIGFPSF